MEKIKIYKPGESWKCECGIKHKLNSYVSAHWHDSFIHTCDCGRKHKIKCGEIELIEVEHENNPPRVRA